MKDEEKMKKGRAGSVIRTLVLIIALCVFCYSAWQLITIFLNYKKGSDEYSSLEQYAAVGTLTEPETVDDISENESDEAGIVDDGSGDMEASDETGAGSIATEEEQENASYTYETVVDPWTGVESKKKIYYMENPVDFKALQEINEDIIGWLQVGALDISYPIAQGEDNDYYLHRTFKREDNFAGCIFIDYQNDPAFRDDNTIVYGHNMKNGSMFGTLRKFLEEGVYESDPYFWIYTPTRIYKYEIFNCSTVGAVSNTYTLSFATREDFQDYLDKAMIQSQVDNESITVTADDKVVTLSTCTGDETTRFVVQGRLARTYAAK